MKTFWRSVLAALLAAAMVAGTETVAGYPRPSEAASVFFTFASLAYWPWLFGAIWLLSMALKTRGLDLWFPVLVGTLRVIGGLAPELTADLRRLVPALLALVLIAFLIRKVADLTESGPPVLFGLTVGMVLPILTARVVSASFASRFETSGRAAAFGALLGALAFVALRALVSKWRRIAPVFLLGPIVSLGLWGGQTSAISSVPGAVSPSASATPARPDIVVIVLDTLRAQALAAYGHPRNTMPNLEAFARQATTFQRVWTNGSWTLPGHISLFSGLRVTRHRYDSGFALLSARVSPDGFLASRLRGAGYATAAVAANFGVLGREEPALEGFESVDVEPLRPFTLHPWLFDLTSWSPRAGWLRAASERFPAPSMRAPWTVDRALRFWMREDPRPKFLFVNFMDAHLPWIPVREDLGRFGPAGLDVEAEQVEVLGRYRSGGRPTPAETETLRARYDESLFSLDRSLTRLIGGVTSGTRNQDTIVVVTSDHGESLGEHDRFGHRNSLDEEATRIPLIVRGPRLEKGERSDAPVQLTDVFGYLMRSAGVEVETGLDAQPFGERRHVVIEHRPGPQGALPSSYPRGDLSALVDWPFKYIEGTAVTPSLFDLSSDPGEQHNLVTIEANRVDAMRQALRDLSGRPSSGTVAPDRAAEERLRALGYVR